MRLAGKITTIIVAMAVILLGNTSLAEDDDTMGITWVILIQNSEYAAFDNIDGPANDVSLIKGALSKYQIDKIIDKQNLSKKQLLAFFTTELKSLINTHKIKSLLIWYAGHGAISGQTSYWIPTDAKKGTVETYISGAELASAMPPYINLLQHTLIITEACKADSKFYTRAPEPMVIRRCTDGYGLGKRSAQSLSFSGYDKALENSRFTAMIAEMLSTSSAECIPIEKLVVDLTEEVFFKNRQIPNFGPIQGFDDQKGTFFFMKK